MGCGASTAKVQPLSPALSASFQVVRSRGLRGLGPTVMTPRCCEQYTARDSVVLAPIQRPEDSIDALIDRALAEDELRDSIQRGEARLKAATPPPC